jgi:hypothetical protein
MKMSAWVLALLAAATFAISPTGSLASDDKETKHATHDDRGDGDRHEDGGDQHKRCKNGSGQDGEHDWFQGGGHRDGDDDCGCVHAAAEGFEIKAPGVNLPNMSTLLSAFVMVNTASESKKNVIVTAITLPGGTLTFPKPLPLDLGAIAPDGTVVLDADFFGGPFIAKTSYPLVVRGTYEVEHKKRCFAITTNVLTPPAAPGAAPLQTTSAPPLTVTGAPFPHQPPAFDNDVNNAGWTVPTAPFVPGTPTPTGTMPQKAPIGDPPTVDFVVNNDWGIGQSGTAEPSGASGGGVVFVTSNWFAAYSTDGGSTFTQLDPTTIFPNDAVGYCCDQIVQYLPSIDRFIWLLQGNGNRIATASPAQIISSKGTAWTYWNLTVDIFGQTGGSFDYPDLSVGNNYLYMTWDVSNGSKGGHLVARTALTGLQAGGTIEIDYTTPSDSGDAWGGHLSQDTGNEIFWAGHEGNSTLRVYSLMEGSNTYYWQDVGISSWANNSPLSSTSPDGQNWINFLFNPTTQNPGGGFPANAVLGLTRDFAGGVWFAWSAGTDNNFPRPHVEMVAVNADGNNPPNLSVNQQVQIWNSSYTFAYPALATNVCTGEVGFSLEGGGDGNYENHLVGFWGDFVAYITTESSVGSTRFGDYVTIRQAPATEQNPGNLFDAFGYGINTVPPPGSGPLSDPHYVQFGRPATSCQQIGQVRERPHGRPIAAAMARALPFKGESTAMRR